MNDNELAPCPFCNGDVTYTFYEDVDHVDSDGCHYTEDHHEILCETCCGFQSQQSPEEWNTRQQDTESNILKEVVSVKMRHPESKEEIVVKFDIKYLKDIIDTDPDRVFDALGEQFCNCQPVGETNVIECNCIDYLECFESISTGITTESNSAEWVAVSERLPEYGVPVVIYMNGVIQQIIYQLDGCPDGGCMDWFEPHHFDCDELKFFYDKAEKWIYVHDLPTPPTEDK